MHQGQIAIALYFLSTIISDYTILSYGIFIKFINDADSLNETAEILRREEGLARNLPIH